ncbi:hypothetical protein GQ54DRAFT_325071 [Martensiomyces pterosporus]|nr:hypothetical protein GQ54DRAFT_325071 [Martensiomyces pterosporus]
MDPEWSPGTKNYDIRVGVMFAVYGIYTVFVLVTLAMFVIKSRNRHSGLDKRSVRLVVLQAIGCFLVGTDGLVSTALNDWACFVQLWLFNIGFSLLITAISGRAVQLIVLSKIHSLNNELSSSGPHTLSVLQSEAMHSRQEMTEHGIDSGFHMGSFPDTINARLSVAIPPRITPAHDAELASQMRLVRKLQWYMRAQTYVTDRVLTIYVSVATLVAVIISIVVNVLNKEFSVRPVSIECRLFWGFVPVIIILCAYLLVICPALLLMVWKLNDAFGIRTDLVICDTVGIVAMILAFLWELKFPHLTDIWSGMFFMWNAMILIHISSVVVPLWHATRHSKVVAYKLHRLSLPESMGSSGQARNGNRSANDGRRSDFNRMLENTLEYKLFREFSAACFCSELTAFIDEYQSLKALTLAALAHQDYRPDSPLHPPHTPNSTLVGEDDGEHDPISDLRMAANFYSGGMLLSAHSSVPLTGPTVSILDSARTAYPHYNLDESTAFPAVIMDKLVEIFSVYINTGSYRAVNIPPILVRRIRQQLGRRSMSLTILDEVKDEILFMLYADVYTRYTYNS